MANKKYKLANSDYWETSGVYDLTEGKTQRAINAEVKGSINSLIEDSYSGIGCFNRIAVIGDSFACGSVYINSTSYSDYSMAWGKILADLYGVASNIYAFGGATTRMFIDSSDSHYNTYGMGKLLSDDDIRETAGLYIIALGINDTSSQSYGVTLGTIADIKTDYTQNPDTFYGNYGRIIATIQENYPNSKIICSTFYRKVSGSVPSNYASYNTAIKAIANKFALPCVDITTDSFFTSADYLDNMVSNHPTAPIYTGMALAYARLIARVMNDNKSYFATYRNNGIYSNSDIAVWNLTPSENVTNIAARCFKIGKLAIINVTCTTAVAITANTVLYTGLPVARNNTEIAGFITTGDYAGRMVKFIKSNSDDALKGWSGNAVQPPSGVQLSFNFVYAIK